MRVVPAILRFLHRLLFLSVGLALTAGAAYAHAPKPGARAARRTAAPPLQALIPFPSSITLRGPYAEARVLIQGRLPGGGARDVSGEAALAVADPRVAVIDADGIVRPRGDGNTVLIARLQRRTARVPIAVRDVAKAGPPRFLTDVLPVLTKAGCNQGACHGAAQGKGGFKLSLLGYDPEADYEAITRFGGARRITRAQPENSLILRKPTLSISHRGGKRFAVGSPEYRLLRDWIAKGVPGPAADEPRVVRLEVFPKVRTLAPGQTQRFIVKACYSNGWQRDVTGETLFSASEESVAPVTPGGEAKAVGPGEGAVIIRYQGLVTTARVISPFGPPRRVAIRKSRPPAATLSEKIDRLVQEKLDALGLEPSGRSADADFLRRAYLDVIGLLPTPEETRAFLASRDPQKREKLIDALLRRTEYVDFWTLKWGDILRDSRQLLSEKGMVAFNAWIRQSVAENKPWDRFARELLLAQGSAYTEGAANYYRAATTPQELAETTSQVFLGVRIQCAKCHNHPYEKWKQSQYYQMAAFFARVRAKPGERPGERIVFVSDTGEVKHPKTQKEVLPCALDAAPLPKEYPGDRRLALAEWLTAPQNPFFARCIVNRLWKHFMGRGLVEPVDDLRVTNPPSNEALLDCLAQDFIRHGYDLKYLMRAIMRSQTYQRSSEPTPGNARDTRYYAHFPFKRLGAEQLPDTGVPSYFLDLFGRPARNIPCECERSDEPNLGQVLHLMNSAGINARLSDKSGRVAALIESKLPDRRVVEELYLASLARFPTPEESRKAVHILAAAKDRQRGAEDLLWALLNSKEFLFNH